MTAQVFVPLLLTIVLVVYMAIAIRTWNRLRGRRVVICPETNRPAGVTVDMGHALTSAVRERADIRIAECSRWPKRRGCEESCVPQIVASIDGTRASTIAGRFFRDRRCVICGRRLERLTPGARQPGFMDPLTHEAMPWHDVPAEELPAAIARRRPLCPDCTLAESSRPVGGSSRASGPDSSPHR